jgi:hypothetical protein
MAALQECLVRGEGIVRLVDKVRLLNLPQRRGVAVVVIEYITVFENASYFDAGQVEYLVVELQLFAFLELLLGDQQVFRLGFERDDCAVRVDGAALDVKNSEVGVLVGNLDGSQLLALLLKDFDARVKAVVVLLIVGDFLDVEVDSGGARSFGIDGHFEFFVGGWLKLRADQGWNRDDEKQECESH